MAAVTPPPQSDTPPKTGRPASSAAAVAAAKRGAGGAGAAGGLLMGKYELGRLLGHGTFAKVYYARHVGTGDNVAIKVLDKEKAVKSGLVPHIKREIAVLRRVRHPNIVHLFEFRPDGLLHTFCGTPAYVAPEVLGRRGYDGAKADVWSCGVILFVLMAGYLPFHDKNIMAMYKKIYKGEFRCARWFSKDLTSLLTRILDTNPNTRITLPEIMELRWFKKGFKPVKFYIEDDQLHNVIDDEDGLLDMGPAGPVPPPLPPPPPPLPPPKVDDDESGSDSDSSISSCPASVLSNESQRPRGSLPRPASLNAFDIISFSRGFNLSGLFEEKGDEVRFISAEPMLDIITKLEDIAKLKSFKLRRKDWRICLEGTREGVKGPLTIGAEIFELTPPLVMVEVKKKAGDNEEYEDFCNKELKPGMQHLVHHMVRAPSFELNNSTSHGATGNRSDSERHEARDAIEHSTADQKRS
ncbi:unnamed protein product [Miscanthus lutarioriparius]|uniref:non-specific serine/threonine protein kinase n=1 Tax=Miscanthus lutarioriparius TaxID=422564 RepID=A0A811P3H7_9POAL|nr:unnamed protein product [Miscanthus lutarioriparius]